MVCLLGISIGSVVVPHQVCIGHPDSTLRGIHGNTLHKGEYMSVTLSIEIYQDENDYFRWVFLDSEGYKHGPSGIYSSRSEVCRDIEKIVAAFLEVSESHAPHST